MEVIMIHINARAIIASSNFVKDALPVIVHEHPVVMDLQTGKGPYTVLGNLASGFVFMNGAELPPFWLPLNPSTLS